MFLAFLAQKENAKAMWLCSTEIKKEKNRNRQLRYENLNFGFSLLKCRKLIF